MSVKLVLVGALAAASLAAGPVRAAVVELHFQDQAGQGAITQFFGPNVYHDWQNSFHAASFGNDYEFKFTYDTDAGGPDYDLTLVSGRVGSFSDFSLWTPTLNFQTNNQLMISLTRMVTTGATYVSGVYFLMRDNDGDIGATIPTAVTLADLDVATVGFENRRSGGVGQGYKNVGYARFEGTFEVPQGGGDPNGGGGPPVGGVPEPGTWALMILGFGAAGAVLRRRRIVLA